MSRKLDRRVIPASPPCAVPPRRVISTIASPAGAQNGEGDLSTEFQQALLWNRIMTHAGTRMSLRHGEPFPAITRISG